MGSSASSVAAPELVAPAFFTAPDYVETLGPEVGELCAQIGYAPDPEQQMVLDAQFGLTKQGRLAAFEVAVIGARQNIKTGWMKQAAIGKVFLLKRPLFVWSAHEFNTTKEAFRDLCVLIETNPDLDRRVAKISRGNGDEAVELLGGQRIIFRARTKSGGRGLSGDDVNLDEAFALAPEHMGALLPVLSTRDNPQVGYGSSAGLATSAVLRGVRNRGRVGAPGLVYAEWTTEGIKLKADGKPVRDAEGNLVATYPRCRLEDCDHRVDRVGCSFDDQDLWPAANPQAGRRISFDYIAKERLALPPAEFGRERMGRWDEPAGDNRPPALDLQAWPRLARPGAKPPTMCWVYVAVSPAGDRATVAVAGQGKDGRTLVVVKTRPGLKWVPKQLEKLTRKVDVLGIALNPRTQAGSLVEDLTSAGIDYEEASSTEVGQACVGMIRAVRDATVEHVGQPELDEAARDARTRRLDEGERFDQRDPEGPDLSPLVAAAGARHRWELEADYDVGDSIY